MSRITTRHSECPALGSPLLVFVRTARSRCKRSARRARPRPRRRRCPWRARMPATWVPWPLSATAKAESGPSPQFLAADNVEVGVGRDAGVDRRDVDRDPLVGAVDPRRRALGRADAPDPERDLLRWLDDERAGPRRLGQLRDLEQAVRDQAAHGGVRAQRAALGGRTARRRSPGARCRRRRGRTARDGVRGPGRARRDARRRPSARRRRGRVPGMTMDAVQAAWDTLRVWSEEDLDSEGRADC